MRGRRRHARRHDARPYRRSDCGHARRISRSAPPEWRPAAAERQLPGTSAHFLAHDLVTNEAVCQGKPASTFPDHARLALHQIDVFNRDRTAVAEIHHQHGKTDRGFGGCDRQHQQRKHLSDYVAEEGRERHQVDVDRQQDQLDRNKEDDAVLAVEEHAEDPERKQDGSDREIVSKADRHCTHSAASASCSPWPEATLRMAMASSGVRAFCTFMSCRLTLALWRSVSTMAPIIATSSTMPAIWK